MKLIEEMNSHMIFKGAYVLFLCEYLLPLELIT